MSILTCTGVLDDELEKYRPARKKGKWELVISGYWSQDLYHSGPISYYIQKTARTTWVMNAVERNAELDGVTKEDVEEGRLNDDQIQAMWGMTLEEAQDTVYERIVAVWLDAPNALSTKEAAAELYKTVKRAKGKIVNEPDDDGLLD